MPRSEKAIQNDTLVALSALDETMVWRNNTGQGWQGTEERHRVGSTVKVTDDMVILRNARRVTFGLPGSADVLGARRAQVFCWNCAAAITVGQPLAVEIKRDDGRQSVQQKLFQMAWEKAGGLYVLTRSPEHAVKCVIHAKIDLTDLDG